MTLFLTEKPFDPSWNQPILSAGHEPYDPSTPQSHHSLLNKSCIPITLPYHDSFGKTIQLWLYRGSVVGSVLNQGSLTIVPGSSISNSLNPNEPASQLARRLTASSPRVWDLAYIERINKIVVWPHLLAAGLDERIQQMNDKYWSIFNDHNNRDDLMGARAENRGESVAFKKNGTPYDHHDEVGKAQRGLTKLIEETKGYLDRSNLTEQQRKELTAFLSKCSNQLDKTAGYRPKDTKATRGQPSPHMANFYAANPQATQKKAFQESLQFNRLTESYNATNPKHPVPAKGATGGSIGGIAHECGIIEGLFDSLESLEEKVHYFLLPNASDKPPFSDMALKTILHELAVGIFVHDSVPFFSLHFNKDSNLYPIIHPIYQNTLVGRTISLLDYHMKGFLHGVFYDEAFIEEWQKDKTQDKAVLLSKCHDIREYCNEHLPGVKYRSMRELIQQLECLDAKTQEEPDLCSEEEPTPAEPKLFSEYSGFRSSFRIIAKQNSFQKTGHLFHLDADFDAFYTIEPDAIYKAELEQYRSVYGKEPSGYQRLVKAYEMMLLQIKSIMPKLPVFAELFEQLKIINFFSYYFKTLKNAQKVPVLEAIHPIKYQGIPLFPHLPVKKFAIEEVEILFDKVLSYMNEFDMDALRKLVQTKETGPIPPSLLSSMSKALDTYLQSKISFSLSNDPEELLRRGNILEIFVRTAITDSETQYLQAVAILPSLESMKEIAKNKVKELESLKAQVIHGHPTSLDALVKAMEVLPKINKDLSEIKKQLEEITDEIEVIQANKNDPFGLFIKIFQIKAREFNSVFEIIKDLPPEEREVQEGIVGGYGQNIAPMGVQEIPNGVSLTQRNMLTLTNLPQATFTALHPSDGIADGYLFALEIDDNVTINDSAYGYMATFLPPDEQAIYEPFSNLIGAIYEGNEELFNQLINPGFFLLQDTKGAHLVHHAACAATGISFLKRLSQEKADFAVTDFFGNTPLHYAAQTGSIEQLTFLLEENPQLINTLSKNRSSPLYVAVQHNRIDTVNFLLDKGANPNLCTIYGLSPLYCAIHNKFDALTLKLLENKKVDLELETEDGNTALFLATEMQNVPIMEALIERGANVCHRRKDGLYPIHAAFKTGSTSVCEQIVFAPKTDVNLRMRSGKTAMYLALEKKNNQDLLRMLLSQKADFWLTGYDKETTLMAAIRAHNHYGAKRIVVHCLLRTPNRLQELLQQKNLRGEDPIHLALTENQPLCLYVLTEQKIPILPDADTYS